MTLYIVGQDISINTCFFYRLHCRAAATTAQLVWSAGLNVTNKQTNINNKSPATGQKRRNKTGLEPENSWQAVLQSGQVTTAVSDNKKHSTARAGFHL